MLIDIEIAQGNWARAATVARNALKVLPGNDEIQLRLGKAHLSGQQWKEAVEALLPLDAKYGQDPEFLHDLGKALVKSGQAKAATKVISRGLKATDNDDYRRRLAMGRLFDAAREYDRAARVFAKVYKDLPRKSKLTESTLQLLARSHHRAGNYLGSCDALVLLRRRDQKEIAYNLFMQLASASGAHHEVASVFDLANAESNLTQTGIQAALKSQLAAGLWGGAEKAITLLGQIDDNAKPRLVLETARIQLGRGQRAQGLATLRRAINARQHADRVAVYVTWLRFLVADNDPRAALELLDEAISAAPTNGMIKRLGGEAALMLGDTRRASALLDEAVRVLPRDRHARLLLCICHAARGSYPEALKALPSPKTPAEREVRNSVLALAGGDPPAGPRSFARFLWHLRAGDCKKASEVAARMYDTPRVWRTSMTELAEHLASHPERAPLTAELFARATAFSAAGMLQDACLRGLSAARSAQVEEAPWIDLFKAWTLLRYGSAKAAATLMAPRIAAGIQDPLVVYLAAIATMRNTSAANVDILIDGHLGKGPIAPDLARDLRDAALELDANEAALAFSGRIAEPADRDLATKSHILYRVGQTVDAGKTAAGLPTSMREADPFLQFIAAYGALLEKKPGARKGREALLEDPASLSALDPVLVVNALVRARVTDKLSDMLTPLLVAEPYDAYTFHHLALAVGRSKTSRPLYDRLMAAASLADPRAALRTVRRKDRPVAQW